MAVTVASLVAKLGYDDHEFQSGVSGSESRISKFGNVAGAALKVGAAAVAAGVAAVGASTMAMQDALTPVMTLTGKGSQQFKEMSDAISSVVSTSPKSAEELGNAAYTILSAGINDTAKAQLALVDSNNLALAGLGSVPDATDLITSAMNSWKDANLSSTDAAQIFFGTIAAGKTTTAQLAQGFGGIAPLASALGVDLKSLMSATAALTATGMPASQAYSSLKAAFANILKPTADASKAAEQLGIDFSASALKSKGLKGFLDEIAGAAGGNTQVLADMFGSIEAGNAVLALTGPQAQAFADNFGIIDEKGKNLSQTAKDVSETFSNRIKIMKNAAMVHLAEIGNKGLDWLSEKWKEWGPTVLTVVERVKETLKTVFTEIIGGFRAFVAAFKAGDGDITSVGFPGFMERVGFVVREIWNWIQDNWPTIKTTFLTVFNAISDWVQSALPTIRDGYISAFNGIKDIVTDVVAVVQEYWPQVSEVFQAALEIIGPMATFLVKLWKGSMDEIGLLWNNGGKQILAVVAWLFGIMTPMIVSALNIIRDIFQTVTDLMEGNWSDAWHHFTQIFVDWWNGFWGTFVNAFGALRNFAGDMFNIGLSLIYGLINGIYAAVPALWNFFASVPGIILSYMGDLGSLLWNAGMDLIRGLVGGIRNMAGAAASAARDAVSGAVNAAKGFLGIGSPSKVFMEIGNFTGEGLALGLNQSRALVEAASANLAGAMVNASQYNYNIGGPGNVNINMPSGSNGNDVVRALRDWQARNGAIPLAVTGRR